MDDVLAYVPSDHVMPLAVDCPVPQTAKSSLARAWMRARSHPNLVAVRRTRHRNGDRATAARQSQHARGAVIGELR